MTLSELQKEIMVLAKEKNFGTKPDDINFGEKVALIHAEVSEVLEAYRKHNITEKDGVAEEIADIIIRTLHLAGVYAIDIEKEIAKKRNEISGVIGPVISCILIERNNISTVGGAELAHLSALSSRPKGW